MPSMTTESASHESHAALHVIIPTTSAARVPSASTPKTSAAESVLSSNQLDTPGHGHGLFRIPGPSTPTTPKMSVRATRRSSLFSMHDTDEPERREMANADADAPGHAQELIQTLLPPTSETEEPSADFRDLKVIGDGQFHVEGDNGGGNN